jgi:hypothetical protein
MKHHKKQQHPQQKKNNSKEKNNAISSGKVTSMIGKSVFTLTFNVDVARALNFQHNESLSYNIIGNQLIIKKEDSNRIDW